MKLTYLGTAAAEGIPALFCDCAVCKQARALGGKEIRTRSQALINDDLLLDFPADAYMHMLQNGLEYSKIKNVLITHAHSDHLYAGDFGMRYPSFCTPADKSPIHVYAAKAALRKIHDVMSASMEDYSAYCVLTELPAMQPVSVGRYTVIALPAVHDMKAMPYTYIISDGEKTMLYAHDTSSYRENVWEYLKDSNLHLDFASLDCTAAGMPSMDYEGHMNLTRNLAFIERLKEVGVADGNTVFCANHFSHNGAPVLYQEFSVMAKEKGLLTSFDGMQITF